MNLWDELFDVFVSSILLIKEESPFAQLWLFAMLISCDESIPHFLQLASSELEEVSDGCVLNWISLSVAVRWWRVNGLKGAISVVDKAFRLENNTDQVVVCIIQSIRGQERG